MTSAQVQRTLVKSPPELWAELSDPAALARHLGELGDIRITRIEPERKLEWTSDGASGTVLINPSGWGTRVTLTASREASQPPAPGAASPPPGSGDHPAHQPSGSSKTAREPAAPDPPGPPRAPEACKEPEPQPKPASSPMPSPAPPERLHAAGPVEDTKPPAAEPIARERAPGPASGEPAPPAQSRRRLFTRVMSRFRRAHPAAAAVVEPQPPPSPVAATREPERAAETPPPKQWPPRAPAPTAQLPAQRPPAQRPPAQHPPAQPATAISPPALERAAELLERACAPPAQEPPARAANERSERPSSTAAAPAGETSEQSTKSANEDVEAVLTTVLDSLGAAHHRPFSRA